MTMINYRKCIIDTKTLLYNYLMDIVNTLTALLDPCNDEKVSNYLKKKVVTGKYLLLMQARGEAANYRQTGACVIRAINR